MKKESATQKGKTNTDGIMGAETYEGCWLAIDISREELRKLCAVARGMRTQLVSCHTEKFSVKAYNQTERDSLSSIAPGQFRENLKGAVAS